MPSGWAAFAGVIIGGVIVLLADLLKHLRLRKERIQDILISRRVDAYSELSEHLTRLWWDLPLIQSGLEPLRWPKNKRVSPEFYESSKDETIKEKKDLAYKTHQRLEQLKRFMYAHQVVLAPSVQRVFWQVFGEFTGCHNALRIYTDVELEQKYPGFFDKTKKALNVLRDRTSEAIMADLGVQGFDVPNAEQIRAWAREGKKKVRVAKGLQGTEGAVIEKPASK